ncbi:AbrB/MazE/SpoVT family DNA-binding domain-containing protein [Halobacteriota archaeon]
MKDRKIMKVGSSYMITLPMDIVRGFGWDENTMTKAYVTGSCLTIMLYPIFFTRFSAADVIASVATK